MAWFARIDSPAVAGQDSVRVPVHYYDDALPDLDGNPSLVWFAETDFPVVGTTFNDVRQAVISIGQRARAANQRAAAINNAAPVGTTVPIP